MNPIAATAIANLIDLGFRLLANHLNKPPGWKPTQQDIDDFLASVDEATPEFEKAEALKRLGLTERIPYVGPDV